MVNDINLLDDIQFKACYQHHHNERNLQILFDVAQKVLVTNRSVKEGVDFELLESFFDKCWSLEKDEHAGDEEEAYFCYKQNIVDRILYGWVMDHLPEGRGYLGKSNANV